MFNNQKKSYSRSAVSYTDDTYNQKTPSYSTAADVNMFISLLANTDYISNDLRIKQATHIATTFDDVAIGDIIGNAFEVTFVDKSHRENLVYLKERQSNGIFS